jgi:hypothetical protein
MSGGHFSYKQYEIGYIADEIEQLILDNDSNELNEYGDSKGRHFNENTIEEFKLGLMALRTAQIYAHRIDWLVSGDDGEDSFHSRLEKDLENMK